MACLSTALFAFSLAACIAMGSSKAQAETPAEAPSEAPSDETPEPAPAEALPQTEDTPLSGLGMPDLQLHGFVSQGAFISTSNPYLGGSDSGSAEFTEIALNVQGEVTERMHAGIQLFSRDVGPFGNLQVRPDWAFLDYRYRDWLGLRAGRNRRPFGLYNEVLDVDAGRVPILLPQSLYPIGSRDFLLSFNGLLLYGWLTIPGGAGELHYQGFGGTSLLETTNPSVLSVDTKYTAGGQLFWRPPLQGLRLGGSVMFTHIEAELELDPDLLGELREEDPERERTFEIDLDHVVLWVVSAEYTIARLVLAAEYSRWRYDVTSTAPDVRPERTEDSERWYGMATYRLLRNLQVGAYYSAHYPDATDRTGGGDRFRPRHLAYQHDVALTLRHDINSFWLVKLEGHYLDGTAALDDDDVGDIGELERRWGFFLVRTTLWF